MGKKEGVVKMAEVVKPYKVVLLGKTEKGYLWQYSYLVFARNKEEAINLAKKEVEGRLNNVKVFKIHEYKKPMVWSELHGAWPEDWVMEELEERGGYDSLPELGGILEET